MASKGTAIQAIRTTTTKTTMVHNRTFARAKGQLLSGTSADEATSKAAVMTTQAPTATTTIAAAVVEITVCRNWAVAVEQTKYRTRNETTNSQLIERINVQYQLHHRQQQRQQQMQHIVGFEKRPATQKHLPKEAATPPTMPIAIKAKTAKTTAFPAKLTLANAAATAT